MGISNIIYFVSLILCLGGAFSFIYFVRNDKEGLELKYFVAALVVGLVVSIIPVINTIVVVLAVIIFTAAMFEDNNPNHIWNKKIGGESEKTK